MSSPIVWADVTGVANGNAVIASFNSVGQTAILALVNGMLNVAMFDGEDGPRTHLARCFMAAHIAASSNTGDAGGAVIMESEGGVTRQYSMPPVGDDLRRTSYGAMYMMLIGPQAHGPVLLNRRVPC